MKELDRIQQNAEKYGIYPKTENLEELETWTDFEKCKYDKNKREGKE